MLAMKYILSFKKLSLPWHLLKDENEDPFPPHPLTPQIPNLKVCFQEFMVYTARNYKWVILLNLNFTGPIILLI